MRLHDSRFLTSVCQHFRNARTSLVIDRKFRIELLAPGPFRRQSLWDLKRNLCDAFDVSVEVGQALEVARSGVGVFKKKVSAVLQATQIEVEGRGWRGAFFSAKARAHMSRPCLTIARNTRIVRRFGSSVCTSKIYVYFFFFFSLPFAVRVPLRRKISSRREYDTVQSRVLADRRSTIVIRKWRSSE